MNTFGKLAVSLILILVALFFGNLWFQTFILGGVSSSAGFIGMVIGWLVPFAVVGFTGYCLYLLWKRN